MYIATRRIYINSAGAVCDEHDPDAASLLLAEGQGMPDAEARKYELLPAEPEAEAEGKAVAAPPHNKALSAPRGSK